VSLLLDTHVVPWWLAGTGLDDAVVERISDGGELVAVSAASIGRRPSRRRSASSASPGRWPRRSSTKASKRSR
jgi:tRNA U34 5-methylaminomethyl-2-thiouridine-forming methyltransferase MnmC